MNVEALESGAPGLGSEAIKPIRATIRERTPGCQDVGGWPTDPRGPGHGNALPLPPTLPQEPFGFENLRHLWNPLPEASSSVSVTRLLIQPPRLFTSRLLKVLHYWVHQTLNRFSTPNYTEKPLTPVPNSRKGCPNDKTEKGALTVNIASESQHKCFSIVTLGLDFDLPSK